eukprot:jgi/Chlat1/8582/Chrsp82S07968
MFGGLYGDLPPPSAAETAAAAAAAATDAATDDKKTAGWSAGVSKLLAPRKASFLPPPAVLRAQQLLNANSPRPRIPVKGILKKESAVTPAASTPTAAVHESTPAARNAGVDHRPATLVAARERIEDEYDPARPNDYEAHCRERAIRRKAEQEGRRQREEERRRHEQMERELERMREKRDEEREPSRASLNISGEEAWKRRAMLSGRAPPPRSPSPPPVQDSTPGRAERGPSADASNGEPKACRLTMAERMMQKMGWQHGEGLGKNRQGMATPLQHQKTAGRSGVIVNAAPLPGPPPPSAKKPKVGGVTFNMPPTVVLLLRNMVGPGEVDDDLEGEVAEECTKYGTVVRVLIFEVTDPNYPATEAVRIYVKFSRAEEATKALVDLDGRFFGGRVVKATFYEEDKFDAVQLAPTDEEYAALMKSAASEQQP